MYKRRKILRLYGSVMEERFKNKYRISATRKPNWDYGSHGLYFITICTHNRVHYFGKIDQTADVETQDFASLAMTPIAEVAHQNWISIPQHFPFIELD